MLTNYFIVAVRNLIRQKGYSLINILGLALGISAAMFIFLWVSDEVSMNRFHMNLKRIYRVEQDQNYNGDIYHVNVTAFPAGEGWKKEIPEIEATLRMTQTGALLTKYGEKVFYESGIICVDSTFFKVLTFPLVKGDPGTALSEPFSIVLTPEMALKYFGNEDPMGKVIIVDNKYNFTVTGLLKKLPVNNSFRFDFLIPFDFTRTTGAYVDHWGSNNIFTFAMLFKGADPIPVDDKLTETVRNNIDFTGSGTDRSQYETKFMLAPLKKLHLHEYFGFGHPAGRIQRVIIFSLIGIFILLIAAINYMNLSTARSSRRSREIGLRKALGSQRKQLISQFFGESLVTSMTALVLSIIIIGFLLDPFRLVSGKQLSASVLISGQFILGMIGMTLFTAIIAGIYPALYLSGFKPMAILTGDPSDSKGKGLLRKILVVFQFSISIFLISSTLLIFRQIHYMQSRDLGYNQKDILYVRLFGDLNNHYSALKEAFKMNTDILVISAGTHLPINIGSNSGRITWDGKDPDLNPLVSISRVDYNYSSLIQVPIKAGRGFSEEFPADIFNSENSTGGMLINESLAKIIGKDDVIGMKISFTGVTGPVVGVIRDFHFLSMRTEIPPLVLFLYPENRMRYMMIRLNHGERGPMIEKLRSTWNSVLPGYPFDYSFIEDDYDLLYQNEMRSGKLMAYFTIIAIIIACLGLIGLSSYMAEKRTREIAIRKTFGSTNMSIVLSMIAQFTRLVLIGILIAIPITWYYLNQWLNDYAYRVSISWWVFAVPALISIVLSTVMVAFQAFKASRTNPAVSLRHQ
ncbi:MAG: ABC transporter permease [Bacteroidales bacterium]|jgi:ABC-type antimicrobial peptide transport system permease subunit